MTTNRDIASLVGITPGALYHYFESKMDLYLAVYQEVQREIVDVLKGAVKDEGTFAEHFSAILDATLEMNRRDPSIGRLNGAVQVDIRRHADIASAARKRKDPIASFFQVLISRAVESGEIDAPDVPLVEAFVRTVLLGITAGLSDDRSFQINANEAVKRAIAGRLV